MTTRNIILTTLLFTFCLTSTAQKRKSAAKAKKQPVVQVVEPTPAEKLYRSMLGATAKIMFVDSMVVDKANFLSKVPLNHEAGSISSYSSFFKTAKGENGSVYLNEFGNTVFYSEGDSTGNKGIFTADRLGTQWSTAHKLNEIGEEFEEQNYPFLMADGITLLFAAKGENSIGGYDIFVTRKDDETGRFYQPENYGLPFNSTANDYLLAFDEFDNLGWLVTDRHQPDGKVCIYTFVPTAQRVPFKDGDVTPKQLESYARLDRIADTWNFGNRAQALKNISAMQQRNAQKTNGKTFFFPVNDRTVYRTLDDFKTKQGKTKYQQLDQLLRTLDETQRALDAKRILYHGGKRNEAASIIEMEKKAEQMQADRLRIEKEIRQAENNN